MKSLAKRLTVWMVAVALMLPLVFLHAEPVYAADEPIQVVGYTIAMGKTSPYTGTIKKNEKITLTLTVFDPNISSGEPAPSIVLNTSSFTIDKDTYIEFIAATAEHPGGGGYKYTIVFTDLKYRGQGNTFECNISYPGRTNPMQAVTLTLNQCVEYVPPTPPAPEPEINYKGTDFVLKDAKYGNGEPIYAGQAFTLSAEILATNGSYAIENISVSFSPPEQLTFADGSSVVYVGTLVPGASAAVSTTLLPSANIQEGSYTISIDVRGVNAETGSMVPGSMTITVPILQPERFEIFNTYLPTDLMANMDMGMGYGSVTLVNQGRGAVGNVTLEVVGDGLFTEDGRTYIGNVGGGEQRSADFNLMASIPGMIEAKVIVTYENVRGEIRTLEHEFYVNVMEGGGDFFDPGWGGKPGFEDPGWGIEDNAGKGFPKWLFFVIIIAAAAVVTILLVRRHKKKKKAAEAELDYDMDDEDI